VKLTGVIAFAAAVLCHTLLLFGFHAGGIARLLPVSETPQTMDVALVDAAPEAVSAETPAPEPSPTPDTAPVPEPMPESTAPPSVAEMHLEPPTPAETPLPQSEPEPTPTQPAPIPEPTPTASPEKAAPQPTHPATAKASHQPTPHPEPPVQATPHRSLVSQWFHCWDSSSGTASQRARPRYRSNPAPGYPEEARRNGQQGVVLISAQVEADGHPNRVTLQRSSGFPLLDAAALDAVRKWTFDPARAGGMPIASRIDVPVRFNLQNR